LRSGGGRLPRRFFAGAPKTLAQGSNNTELLPLLTLVADCLVVAAAAVVILRMSVLANGPTSRRRLDSLRTAPETRLSGVAAAGFSPTATHTSGGLLRRRRQLLLLTSTPENSL
jgi:hypothetical protein